MATLSYFLRTQSRSLQCGSSILKGCLQNAKVPLATSSCAALRQSTSLQAYREKPSDLLPLLPTASVQRPFHASAVAQSGAASHNATAHFKIERLVATALIGLLPLPFFFYHPALDYIVAAGIVLHAHFGLHAMVHDYLRPKILGPPLAKVCELFVLAVSTLAFAGLMLFNFNDIGLIHLISGLWKSL